MKKALGLAAALSLVACAQSAMAVDSAYNSSAYEVQPQVFGKTQNSIGVAGLYSQQIYKGVDNKAVPFPLLNFTYNNFLQILTTSPI